MKKKQQKNTLDELVDAIEELYSRYWEREDSSGAASIGFEVGEVYTLARILKKETEKDKNK